MDLLNSGGGFYWTYTEYGHIASTGPITVRQYASNYGRYRIDAGGDYGVHGAGSFPYTLELDGSGTILSVTGLPAGSLLTGDGTSTIAGPVSAAALSTTISGFSGIRLAGISVGGSLSLGDTGGNIMVTGSIGGNVTIGNYSGMITAQSIAGDLNISHFTGNIQCSVLNPNSLPANILDHVHPKWDCSEGPVTWTVNGQGKACPPGQATSPIPADAATAVPTTQTLSWTAGVGATSHDVYFGTSLSAVQNATPASPEFRGNQTAATFDPGPLALNTAYYWNGN